MKLRIAREATASAARTARACAIAMTAARRYFAGKISDEDMKAEFNRARALIGWEPLA